MGVKGGREGLWLRWPQALRQCEDIHMGKERVCG